MEERVKGGGEVEQEETRVAERRLGSVGPPPS
jgi:hypothetical protein